MSETRPGPDRSAATIKARPTLAGDLPVFQPTQVVAGIGAAGQATVAIDNTEKAPPEAIWSPGVVLCDRYRIVGLLGAGGMGVVYKAEDLKLGHAVALKFLSVRLMSDAQRLEALYNEVRLGRQVSHPNVCRIYDIGETEAPAADGSPGKVRVAFLCMEFLDGENLDVLLRRGGKLPPEKAMQVAQNLCAGLAAVHDQGMLHRDLKPSNVMMDEHGVARLTDFGVAALARDVGNHGLVGTPGYLSPEALEGKTTTVQSDIYALGLTLCEIFTGKSVFKAYDVPTQINEARMADLPRLPALAGIEPPVLKVLLRCLRADPAQRPRTVRDVAAALSEAAQKGLRERTLLLGVGLMLILLLADAAGMMGALQRGWYDFRARHCQFDAPPPSADIYHVDIDDAALEEIGRWPWPRSQMARIMTELERAKPRVIGMDVVYSEPELPQPQQQPDGSWGMADGDNALAKAIADGGNVLVPVNIPLDKPPAPSAVEMKLVELLERDLEQTPEQLQTEVTESGLDAPDLAEQIHRAFPFALRQALARRIDESLGMSPGAREITAAAMRQRLLPRSFASGIKTPADHALEQVLPRVLAARKLERFTLLARVDLPPMLSGQLKAAEIPALAEAARYCGFVDYQPSVDDVVRWAPMFVQYRDRLMPQAGLALACAYLGVDVRKLKIEADRVVIPRSGAADIVIPVHTVNYDDRGAMGLFMDIPWSGTSQWQTMYDYPNHQKSSQHLPINRVWDVCELSRQIEENNQQAASDVEKVLQKTDIDKLKAYQASAHPALDDVAGWSSLMKQANESLDAATRAGLLDPGFKPANGDETALVTALRNLNLRSQLDSDLAGEEAGLRQRLRAQLQGKAVLIGVIASSEGDLWHTPLHLLCPGVVIHGQIFSGIVTGHLWRSAPKWVDLSVLAGLGLLMAAAVTWLSPRRAAAAAGLLVGGYLAVNAVILFARHHILVDAAGPVVAVLVVWSVCGVTRLVVMLGRARTAARWTRAW